MNKSSLFILCLALIAPLGAAEPTPAKIELPQPAASPAQIELARQVIKASQFDRVFDQMGAQMQQMAAQSMNLTSPDMSPAKKEAAMKTLDEVMKLSVESTKALLQKVDVIYAEVYSEAELKAMLGFFESAEGKSMLQKQPQVMQRMMPLVQGMQRELMPKIQQIVEKAKAAEAASSAPTAGPTPLPSSPTSGPMPMPSSSKGPAPVPAPQK